MPDDPVVAVWMRKSTWAKLAEVLEDGLAGGPIGVTDQEEELLQMAIAKIDSKTGKVSPNDRRMK